MTQLNDLMTLIPPETLKSETFAVIALDGEELRFFLNGDPAVVAEMMTRAMKAMFDVGCSFHIHRTLSPMESPGFTHIT